MFLCYFSRFNRLPFMQYKSPDTRRKINQFVREIIFKIILRIHPCIDLVY